MTGFVPSLLQRPLISWGWSHLFLPSQGWSARKQRLSPFKAATMAQPRQNPLRVFTVLCWRSLGNWYYTTYLKMRQRDGVGVNSSIVGKGQHILAKIFSGSVPSWLNTFLIFWEVIQFATGSTFSQKFEKWVPFDGGIFLMGKRGGWGAKSEPFLWYHCKVQGRVYPVQFKEQNHGFQH